MVRRALLLATLAAAASGVPAASAADPPVAPVIIDSLKVEAVEKESDWTATLTFTNLTTDPVTLTVKPTASPPTGCGVKFSKNGSLPEAQMSTVDVEIDGACNVTEKGFGFTLDPSVGPATLNFPVVAKPPAKASPDWGGLRWFLVALVVLSIGAVFLFLAWDWRDDKNERFFIPMEYVDDSWSFKESWVSNITVAGGLLTGILGSSDILTSFLGDGAKAAITVSTVGAAIAALCVGAGGLVLLATRKGALMTVGGLICAAVITVTGAAGELLVVAASVDPLVGGVTEKFLYVAVAAGLLLLCVYAWRSTIDTLVAGTTKPPDPDPFTPPFSEALVVAAVGATDQPVTREKVLAMIEKLKKPDPEEKPKPKRKRPKRTREGIVASPEEEPPAAPKLRYLEEDVLRVPRRPRAGML